jgi:hypothetical protein
VVVVIVPLRRVALVKLVRVTHSFNRGIRHMQESFNSYYGRWVNPFLSRSQNLVVLSRKRNTNCMEILAPKWILA